MTKCGQKPKYSPFNIEMMRKLFIFFVGLSLCVLHTTLAQRYKGSQYALLDIGMSFSQLQITGIRGGYGYQFSNDLAFEAGIMYEKNTSLSEAITYNQITTDITALYFVYRKLAYIAAGGGLFGSYEFIGKLNLPEDNIYVGAHIAAIVEFNVYNMMLGIQAKQYIVNNNRFGLLRSQIGITFKYLF